MDSPPQYKEVRVSRLEAMESEIERLRKCLAFFRSVIKSGESWSATCDEMFEAARKGEEGEG